MTTNIFITAAQQNKEWGKHISTSLRDDAKANNGSASYSSGRHELAASLVETSRALEKQMAAMAQHGLAVLPTTLDGKAREALLREIRETRQVLRTLTNQGDPVLAAGKPQGVVPYLEEVEEQTRKGACGRVTDWFSKKKVFIIGVAAGIALEPRARNLALKGLELIFQNGALVCGALQTAADHYGVNLNQTASFNSSMPSNSSFTNSSIPTGTYRA